MTTTQTPQDANGATIGAVASTAGLGAWSPIETAPKDGTNILLLLHPEIAERSGYRMEICHYEKRPLLGETWTAQNDGFSTELAGATHWQPMPEAPNLNSATPQVK